MTNPHPLETILAPKSVAFLGASDTFFTMGTAQLHNMLQGGYSGDVYPVHPKLKTVLGRKVYPSVLDLPDGVEVAVMVLPTRLVPDVLDQCGRKGIRHATVISGGFAETGEEGRALQKRILEITNQYGIRFNGPNCIGVVNPGHKYNITWFPNPGRPGPVGLASQSGTYVCHTFCYLNNLGTGLSKAVSLGNEVSIDLVDCLEYFENDRDTKAIAMYVEGIRRGPEFIRTARRVARKKPIVALYVGGTEAGARAGASHTAAMSGPDEVYDGVFRQAGVLRAGTFEELFDWSWTLAMMPPPKGTNMAVLTNSGGPGGTIADACSRLGMQVPVLHEEMQEEIRKSLPHTASPRNPIDVTFAIDGPNLFLNKIPKLLFSSPDIHGLLIYGVFSADVFVQYSEESGLSLPATPDEMRGFEDRLAEKFSQIPGEFGKPIVGTTFFTRNEDRMIRRLQDLGMPFLPSPERAASAMGALYRYGKIKEKLERQE